MIIYHGSIAPVENPKILKSAIELYQNEIKTGKLELPDY